MRRICLNGSIPAKHILADKRKINTNRTKTTKMKQQTAKLILLAAFLFGAVVIIRLQEEPSSSFIGLAAEHSIEHGSDIGLPMQCTDLKSCCEQGGGVYCAYNKKRGDEKCCSTGETCEIVSFALGAWQFALCNAATTCPKKCPGTGKFANIRRCCAVDDDCGRENNRGAPVCY